MTIVKWSKWQSRYSYQCHYRERLMDCDSVRQGQNKDAKSYLKSDKRHYKFYKKYEEYKVYLLRQTNE